MRIGHLSEDIITPGFIPREQLKYAYEQADVFAYPSLYEGSGLPPLEAMVCGTPVLSSDIDCFSEILADSAMLVDPHDVDAIRDRMMRLIRAEDAAEKLRQRGRRRVKEFTWAKTRERLLNVLLQPEGSG